MPKISAKTITARMSLVDMAVTILLGMIASTAATPVGLSAWPERIAPAPSRAPASNCCAWAWSTPAPGWKILVTASARTTAMPETSTVKARVLSPTRLSAPMSPISVMPTISAETSSGMTSMKIRRRKIWPIGPVT